MSEIAPNKFEGRGEKLDPKESRELQKNLSEKRSELAAKSHENKSERTKEALREVHEQAASAEDYARPTENKRQADSYKGESKKLSFDTTMRGVRRSLNKPEKAFSKFIHQPTVEKVSDIAGKTVARPSGVAGATIAAFVGVMLVYGIAMRVGFQLSGSEMPILLIIGFISGILFEWLFKSIRSIFSKNKA